MRSPTACWLKPHYSQLYYPVVLVVIFGLSLPYVHVSVSPQRNILVIYIYIHKGIYIYIYTYPLKNGVTRVAPFFFDINTGLLQPIIGN